MTGFFAKRINQNCIELIHIQDYSNGSRLKYRKTMRAITLEKDIKKKQKQIMKNKQRRAITL